MCTRCHCLQGMALSGDELRLQSCGTGRPRFTLPTTTEAQGDKTEKHNAKVVSAKEAMAMSSLPRRRWWEQAWYPERRANNSQCTDNVFLALRTEQHEAERLAPKGAARGK